VHETEQDAILFVGLTRYVQRNLMQGADRRFKLFIAPHG